jgi:hypothetical protein
MRFLNGKFEESQGVFYLSNKIGDCRHRLHGQKLYGKQSPSKTSIVGHCGTRTFPFPHSKLSERCNDHDDRV